MMAAKKHQYRLKKMSRRKTGYPFATIAYYGEDDQFASKVVVGIILKSDEVAFMKKWFAKDLDLRFDQKINKEILDFLNEHNVHRVAMLDRIIGCPHEEGIDYPKGEKCPECPFWANRDRWTGELIH